VPLPYQRLQRVIHSVLALMLAAMVMIMGIMRHHLLGIILHRPLFMRHMYITPHQELFTLALITIRHVHRLVISIMTMGIAITAIKAGITVDIGIRIDAGIAKPLLKFDPVLP